MFGKRYLGTIYNEWKGTSISPELTFEPNYEKYFKEMFKTHELFKKRYEKGHPISYHTDGYAISILFRGSNNDENNKSKPGSKKKKPRKNAKPPLFTHPTTGRLKPGLYEADSLSASKIQLAQYHITSIDPGNYKMLNCVTYDSKYLEEYVITKGYYNEQAHINRNTKGVETKN